MTIELTFDCVLQCVAVCCSVLQCVAVCYSVLQYVAVCCGMLQYVAQKKQLDGCTVFSSKKSKSCTLVYAGETMCACVVQCCAVLRSVLYSI